MRKKNNNNVPKIIRKYFQIFLQKIILSINLFLKNELLNHAGAAAFFFLLSVTPIFLLLLLSFDHYLTSYPYVSDNFFVFLKNVNENLDKDLLIKFGLLNVKTTAIGVFGLLNLLWAGRWILTSIHRGLRIAFPAETISTPMVIKILSFLILSILLLISVLVTFVSIGFNFFQFFIPDNLIGQTFFQFIPTSRYKTISSVSDRISCNFFDLPVCAGQEANNRLKPDRGCMVCPGNYTSSNVVFQVL